MPIKGTAKEKRQYEHIKDSAKKRGTSTKRAKEIAARTVNKQKSSKKTSSGKSSSKKKSSKKS